MLFLYMTAALAGQIIIDGKVPMSVAIDGTVVAQTYQAARLSVEAKSGLHAVTLTVAGNPKKVDVLVEDSRPSLVLVGRNGVSVGAGEVVDESVGAPEIRFQVNGRMSLMVQVGSQRVVVSPGDGLVLPVALGTHDMSVRSADGTAVFARGKFEVGRSAEPVVVQLTQGALPETAGAGVTFYPDRS